MLPKQPCALLLAFQSHFQSLLSSKISFASPPTTFSPLYCMQVATLTFLLPGSASHLPPFQPFSFSWPQNPHFAAPHTGGSFSIPPLSFLSTAMICSSKLLVSLAPHSLSVFPLLLVIIFSLPSSLHSPASCRTKHRPIYLVLQDTHEKLFMEHSKVT